MASQRYFVFPIKTLTDCILAMTLEGKCTAAALGVYI